MLTPELSTLPLFLPPLPSPEHTTADLSSTEDFSLLLPGPIPASGDAVTPTPMLETLFEELQEHGPFHHPTQNVAWIHLQQLVGRVGIHTVAMYLHPYPYV